MKWSGRLDSFLRNQDFVWNRTAGGVLDSRLGIGRHTVAGVVLTSVVCALMVGGTSADLSRRWLFGLIAGVLATVINVIALRNGQSRGKTVSWDARIQVALVLLVALVMWLLTDWNDIERDGGLYRHVGLLAFPIFAVGVLMASFVVSRLFGTVSKGVGFAAALKTTELFVVREQPSAVTVGIVVRSILTAAFRAPLRLLLPAAIVVLAAWPGEVSIPRLKISMPWATALGLATLAVTIILLTVAGIRRRLDTMLSLAEGPFFRGGALLVSLFVIAVAVARLADFSYVSTLLDSAPGQTILLWSASMYVMSWWYDYWTRRPVTEQLLGSFGTAAAGSSMVDYPFTVPNPPITRVPAAGRALQVHGTGRFIVLCPNKGDRKFSFFFHAYEATELFALLAGSASGTGADTVRLLEQQTRTFGMWLAGVPIAGLLAFAWFTHNLPQHAEVVARSTVAARVTPAAMLFGGDACSGGKSRIVLAASGGGTRAALYTASVLDGLAQIGQLDNVRIVSGISGGGAALAYFVSHRDELSDPTSDAWNRYFELMAAPYIQDVLNGAGELRVAGSTRLGTLLAESFEHRWQLQARKTLGDIAEPGLILNSSLAGDLDKATVCAKASNPAECLAQSLEDVDAAHRGETSTALAPGRLVYTNLALENDYPHIALASNTIRLPIVVVNRSDVKLTDAAAANANFPPVFSNAAVDVDDTHRYWVSDGGVLDNRAMETLLYAMFAGITATSAEACPNRPDLHVIVADASAFSDSFQQDRAIGTAIAAGSSFASQLVAEVFTNIATKYLPGKVWFHYLPMPNLLRRSGAFGTHWMLQPRIRVLRDQVGENWSGPSIARVIRAMHGDNSVPLDADEYALLRSTWTDVDKHGDLWWKDIVDTLK